MFSPLNEDEYVVAALTEYDEARPLATEEQRASVAQEARRVWRRLHPPREVTA